MYEVASFTQDYRTASWACVLRLSYTAHVFASDCYKAGPSITITRSLALLEIDSDAGHFRALIHDARRARQFGGGPMDTSDRLRCRC